MIQCTTSFTARLQVHTLDTLSRLAELSIISYIIPDMSMGTYLYRNGYKSDERDINVPFIYTYTYISMCKHLVSGLVHANPTMYACVDASRGTIIQVLGAGGP
jgi:hypothetical protein